MFKARIADFNILFDEYYNYFWYVLGGFEAEFDSPDITITTTLEDIEEEKKTSENPEKSFRCEVANAFRKLATVLPEYDACVFHSCFIKAEDKGIAFSARSGTGKTTHMRLWQEMLGDKMEIVNGDKPIVRIIDGDLFGYGTPWCGKERLGGTGRAPLTDICIIERSETNETIPVSKDEGMLLLVQQIYMPKEIETIAKTMEIINKITEKCNFWKIRCNMEPDAAITAYNAIFGKEKK